MVAALTPPNLSYLETYTTPRYAELAIKRELVAKKNVLNVM